jgi:hypothetical protein
MVSINRRDVNQFGRAAVELRWNPGPEYLAQKVAERGNALMGRIAHEFEVARDEAVEDAHGLGIQRWEELTGRAEDSFVARRERFNERRGQFILRLSYGDPTLVRGTYYGFVLEAQENQHGPFDHDTAVLEQALFDTGTRLLDRLTGALEAPGSFSMAGDLFL